MTDTSLTTDAYLACEWVPRDAIVPNSYNPNEMTSTKHEILVNSISTNGWTAPIVVHPTEHFIIDGEQRWTVADSDALATDASLTPSDVPAGWVPVVGLAVSGDDARVATIQHNRARGHVDMDRMDAYADVFDADELAEMGVERTELYDIIDDEPESPELPDVDDEPERVDTGPGTDGMSSGVETPAIPDAETVTVMCSPAEKQFITAVIQDGEALDEYVSLLDEHDLVEPFIHLASDR